MNLRSRLYHFYNQKIFPKINHIRGSTRLNEKLKTIALNSLEKIDEDDIEPIDSKEWDNLIILDACRHDIYEEVTGREVESRISLGSTSSEFVQGNFSEGDWEDTVVITGNPFYRDGLDGDWKGFNALTGRKSDDVFHTVFPCYEKDWDKELETVHPSSIVEKVKLAEKLFPEKRKIIHFMQPHSPYIDSSLDEERGFDLMGRRENEGTKTALQLAEKGELNQEEIISAYKQNLDMVLEHAEECLEVLDGISVITADHGELLGERGFYGHPDGLKTKELRQVPWHEI